MQVFTLSPPEPQTGLRIEYQHDIGNIYYTIQPKYSWGSLYDDDGRICITNRSSLANESGFPIELSLIPRGNFWTSWIGGSI